MGTFVHREMAEDSYGGRGTTPDARTRDPARGCRETVALQPFLHYALDVWLRRHLRSVRFCRYADDGVIHCQSEAQAPLVLRKLGERLGQCGLELHREKARIVYCQVVDLFGFDFPPFAANKAFAMRSGQAHLIPRCLQRGFLFRKAEYPVVQFTFLGYTFRPRKAVDKVGRVYENFSPGVSREALTAMRQTVRSWHVQLKCDKELSDLSNMFGPVLRGWSNYYGRFYASAMKPLWWSVNDYLVRWMQGKYKRPGRAERSARPGRLVGLLNARRGRSCIGKWNLIPGAHSYTGLYRLQPTTKVGRGRPILVPPHSQNDRIRRRANSQRFLSPVSWKLYIAVKRNAETVFIINLTD